MNLRAVLEADAHWSQRLRVAESPGPMRTMAGVLAHSGDSWFWAAGLALTWWRASQAWSVWAIRSLAAIAALAAIVLIVKLLVRRRRPEGEWGAVYRVTDPHSFPSGHAARAVLLAILAAAWAPSWFAVVVFIWAPLVALSRVAMGLHYLSDVVVGAGLGLLAGATAVLLIH